MTDEQFSILAFLVPVLCAALAGGISAWIAYARATARLRPEIHRLEGKHRIWRDTLSEGFHMSMGKDPRAPATPLSIDDAVSEAGRLLGDSAALRHEVSLRREEAADASARLTGAKVEIERAIRSLYKLTGMEEKRPGMGGQGALAALRAWVESRARRFQSVTDAEERISAVCEALVPDKFESGLSVEGKLTLIVDHAEGRTQELDEIRLLVMKEAVARGMDTKSVGTVSATSTLIAEIGSERERLAELTEFATETGERLKELGLLGAIESFGVALKRMTPGSMVGVRRTIVRGGDPDLEIPSEGFPGVIIRDEGHRTMPGNREGELHSFDPEKST